MNCTHLDTIRTGHESEATADGCVDCIAAGTDWLHLRRCVTCGHIGCCDSSPMKHATAHARTPGHPIVQSFEPGEDWLWCYVDEVAFEVDELDDSPSHT